MTDSMQSVEQVRPDKETRKKDYFRGSESPTHGGDGFFDRLVLKHYFSCRQVFIEKI